MPANSDGIRLYPHPGKFEGETMVTVALYELAGDGCDEECCLGEGEWYGLLRGPFTAEEMEAQDLTETERRYLASRVGAIIWETPQGFVGSQCFLHPETLERQWRKLVQECHAESEEE